MALLWLTKPVHAQSQKTDIRPNASRVIGDELLAAFKGITHDGSYNFSREGAASNFYKETHNSDGSVNYVEGKTTYKGIWIPRQDSICYRYIDTQLSGGCFRVYRIKNCYYFYTTTRQYSEDELDRDYWTARSVKNGEVARCEAVIS